MPKKNVTEKPKKPTPDFPLTPRRDGRWVKKIRGKVHYFGSGSDPDEALRDYLARKDYIYAGVDPEAASLGSTLGWLSAVVAIWPIVTEPLPSTLLQASNSRSRPLYSRI